MLAIHEFEVVHPLNDIAKFQNHFLSKKSITERKELGQFFTGSAVAEYMASLITIPQERNIRILDAGAGAGILTVYTALHCLSLGCKSIHAVLYENDKDVLSTLNQSLKIVQHIFDKAKAKFTYKVSSQDFVIARPDKNLNIAPFDIAVINPPYFKYSATSSVYSRSTSDLYNGDPNIYASFMAVVMASMSPEGQMITITPRSFTNGLYFKGLRKYLLKVSSLELIHIFKDRNKVFNNAESSVLQENIICRFVKGKSISNNISIRSSNSDYNISGYKQEHYPNDLIIDSSNCQQMIRIPESVHDSNILKQAELFESTFEGAGYFISTGKVVEHRTMNFITKDTQAASVVPLYRAHNINPFFTRWTGEHSKDVGFQLLDEHQKHTIQNQNYVLLKRLTSKDEKKRLVASVHIADKFKYPFFGFGNKMNYIGVVNDILSITEAIGIALVLNSTFMDKYFRCVSGNTQVNATEIRLMKFPSRHQVVNIGEQATNILSSLNTLKIDNIVNEILGVVIPLDQEN